MKKTLSILLSVLTMLSLLLLTGCGEKTVKFGVGSYTSTEDKPTADGGKSKTEVTVATVLLDSEGKILDCAIDAIDIEAKFDQKGVATDLGELKTKYQMGDKYGMKEYGNAKGEWYQEVDGFIRTIKGKTITDVKALVATDKKGKDDVVKAGCTIEIEGFVMAIEKAADNAKEFETNKDGRIKLNVSAKQTKKEDATNESNGELKAEVSFEAKLEDKDKNTVKSDTGKVETSAKFDNNGKFVD